MKLLRPSAPSAPRSAPPRRAGTTLSEVLVSVLVMSIGVVALATLFPISVLRSIQASQLTNATNLRYNAEAEIRILPELINIGSEWLPAQSYNQGDIVVPPIDTRRKLRAAAFVCTTAGTSGGAEPNWTIRQGANTPDGGVQWQTYLLENYVVDPLGYHLVDPNNALGFRARFGNDGTAAFDPYNNSGPSRRFPIYRFAGFGGNNESLAAGAAVLPDSWKVEFEGAAGDYSINPAGDTITVPSKGVDLMSTFDANGDGNVLFDAGASASERSLVARVVLFDDSGRRSETRTLVDVTNAGGNAQLSISPPYAGTLPSVTKMRLETLERRYSYLLSVRRSQGSPSHVDVVVCFRRDYQPQSEQVYPCIFRKIDPGPDGAPGAAGVDDNNVNGTDELAELGWPGTDDQPRSFVIVQYSSTGEKPFYKKGGFICDALNLRWYRIVDVTEDLLPPFTIAAVTPTGYSVDPVATGRDRFVRLTLDQPIIVDSPMDSSNNPIVTNGSILGGAILMRGIVDVYPIRPQMPWEE